MLAALAIVASTYLAYQIAQFSTFDFLQDAAQNWRTNFAAASGERLTDSGQAQIAAVSPFGDQVAYVVKEDDRQSLWIRETDAGNARQLVAPDAVLFAGVTFSPNGQAVYYTAWSQNFIARNLYRVPIKGGGAPQLILEQVNDNIGFSPSGKRFAYSSYDQKARSFTLRIAELGENGSITTTRTLAEFAQPNFLASNPSFAPDGQKIAYFVGETAGRKDAMSLYVFDLTTNAATKIGERTFGDVGGISWRGDEIVVSAAEHDGPPYQLWSIEYPSGAAARLTNDFISYYDVSLARQRAALVTARREKYSAVWLVDLNQPDDARQLTAGSDRLDGLNGLSWTTDNRILYVGGVGTQYALMTMNPDGGNGQTLDVNVVRPSFPVLSKDGRDLVFADSKEDGSSVWRYDTQSGALAQLTPNYAVAPSLTPDGRFVIYAANNAERKLSLHKIPIGGGAETPITKSLSASAVASPDGKFIACYYLGTETGNSWRIVIMTADDGAVRRLIMPPDTFNQQTPVERPLAWSPDNRFLYYLNDKNNVSNIFRVEVEAEKPPVKITNFTSGRIYDFALSPEGNRAVVARGTASSDIFIFRNAQ